MVGQATVRATPADWKAGQHTHHLSLADGTNTVGFLVMNGKGEPDVHALVERAYPKSTLPVGSAAGQLSERQAPFGEFSRSEWIGGLGQEEDSDSTKYYFGERVWTASPGKVILAPHLFLQFADYFWLYGGAHNMPRLYSDTVSEQTPGASVTHIAVKFTPGVTFIIDSVVVYMYGFLTDSVPTGLHLYSDVGNQPGSILESFNQSERGKITRYEHCWIGSSTVQLTASTSYWLVFPSSLWTGDFSLGQTNGSYLGKFHNNLTIKESTDGGSSWGASSLKAPLYLCIPKHELESAQFINYKRGLYYGARVGLRSTATYGSALWGLLGDRGAADDNAGDKTKLNDATKSTIWSTNLWAGGVVRITAGPGKGEWRVIVSNTTTSLTVSPAWITTHTTATEYVIDGVMTWFVAAKSPGLTTFKGVVGSDLGVLYFPQGQSVNIRRVREYDNAGTWAEEGADDGTNKADLLLSGYDASGANAIWKGNDADAKSIAKATAAAWGTALTFGSEIKIGGIEEDLRGLADWEEQTAVTLTGSVWLVDKRDGVPDRLNVDLSLRASENGVNPAVMSPYLVFPYGNGIERLYNNIMEDFGPEAEDGLPDYYGGVVTDTLPVPGGLLMAKDTHVGDSGYAWSFLNRYSGIYLYRNGGWHPVGTLPYRQQAIALHVERMETRQDLLWIGTRQGISYMQWPREFDWRRDTNHTWEVCREGYLITSWFNAGNVVAEKWWKDITLHVRDVSSTEKILVYYETEDDLENSVDEMFVNWHYAGTTTAAGGFIQTVTLNKTSQKIRFMFVLKGNGAATPELNGYNVQYLARIPATDAYPVTVRLADAGVDLRGIPEDMTADEVSDLIKTWAAAITPLTFRCVNELFDNRSVVIERNSVSAFAMSSGDNQLTAMAAFTMIVS